MYPLMVLAFASLVLGITYIFPREWVTTKAFSSIATTIFISFPYLVFFSLIITFHNEKNNTTLISAVLFIMVLVTVQNAIKVSTDIDPYLLSNSVFSMILCSIVFIINDKLIKRKWLWVGVGLIYALVLIPILMLTALIVRDIGFVIGKAPYGLNSFLYGVVNRLLLPFGLHSLMIPTFNYSAVGGTLEITNYVSGAVYIFNGDSAIWNVMYVHGLDLQADHGQFSIGTESYKWVLYNNDGPGMYQQGFLPLTTFIFPMIGISFVIVNGWPKGKYLFTATMITMCSGITEVTEYMFLYTNIYLYLLEVFFVGLSFMLCNVLDVTVWISTGWFIDIILFGVIPSMQGFTTNWYWIPVIGISIGAVYSILFNIIDRKSKNPISV